MKKGRRGAPQISHNSGTIVLDYTFQKAMIRVTMVGRPKEFDEQQALEQAMTVFWTYGYEATSVQDLLDAMGINRGSMYDTFGDKHALFSAAIDHYGRTVTSGLEDLLDSGGSPLGTIRKTLRALRDQALKGTGTCSGCMATHTAIELDSHDAATVRVIRRLFGRMEKAFLRALDRAVEAGELSSRTDTRALARFFTGTVQGLVVLGKAAPPKAALDDVINVALSVLK